MKLSLVSIPVFILVYLDAFAKSPLPPKKVTTANFECEIILDIYNGLYDWVDEEREWSGGQLLANWAKITPGAVTVANLNDTDGDSIPDKDDNEVLASSIGRDEIDLMKLVVRKKNPASTLSGNVTLRKISGTVKL